VVSNEAIVIGLHELGRHRRVEGPEVVEIRHRRGNFSTLRRAGARAAGQYRSGRRAPSGVAAEYGGCGVVAWTSVSPDHGC
jgi:hypothetical protein